MGQSTDTECLDEDLITARQRVLRECMILPNGYLHAPAFERKRGEPFRWPAAETPTSKKAISRVDPWEEHILVGLFLVLLPPVGALVLWSSPRYTREARIAASVSAAFATLVTLFAVTQLLGR